VGSFPEVSGFEGIAGGGASVPFRGDGGSAEPCSGGWGEAADAFEDEGDEGGDFGVFDECYGGAAAEFIGELGVEWRGSESGDVLEASGIEEEAAVSQEFPAGERIGIHLGAPGRRISMATGKT
jgi:hypothetical protein